MTNIGNDQESLERALMQARQAMAAGQLAQAVEVYTAILGVDASHAEALNALAMNAMRSGDLGKGVGLLEKAAQIHPRDALTLNNLGQAYQAANASQQALAAYTAALSVKPELYVTRLSVARLLEQAGRGDEALPLYFKAIADAQRHGRWLSADSTSLNLQPLVQHAIRVVNEGRRKLFGRLMDGLQQQFGSAGLTRVADCLAAYLGERQVQYSDPEQRPTFLYFPGLPASPYLDKRLVPELEQLEASTEAIRYELLAVLDGQTGMERVFLDDSVEDVNLRGYRGKPSWNGYYFHRHGDPRKDNRAACPYTAAALDRLPLCRVREHGPETLFSVLAPGTHLLPHRGVTNTRSVGHLALIVPPDCALSVSGIEYQWSESSTVLFDDTYSHEAWNKSDRLRIVLIFDIWNPYLTEMERAAVKELVMAIGDFRVAGETLPALPA
ncbi:aspartyl/asparaginyl beta-hydroxylase domain-containing protein [Hydrocarboniphaga sp.]|uniref:aspartyl/asparaginyl beta-hydroxylase domain-containing protein n=1 Tax=Hydrocarboniphaga sp. TaxID=2033016 RepID=UPI003D0F61B1